MPKIANAPAPTEAEKAARKEAKAAKFKEIGAKRTNVALEKIGLLSNLANKNSYEFTAEEVEKMVGALKNAVKNVEAAFETALVGGKAKTGGFEF